MQKFIAALLLATALISCGKSEEQIRVEERAKYLQQENAKLEAQLKDDQSEVAPEEPAQPTPVETAPIQAAAPTKSSIRTESGASALIGSYVAFIGEDDLYNSSGTRLTQPWAILRQDRANFHKFGIQHVGDTSDPLFSNAANRESMERLLKNGSISADARARITQGGAAVRVQVYGQGSAGQRVDVTVY